MVAVVVKTQAAVVPAAGPADMVGIFCKVVGFPCCFVVIIAKITFRIVAGFVAIIEFAIKGMFTGIFLITANAAGTVFTFGVVRLPITVDIADRTG